MLENSHKIYWVAHRGNCEHHIENTLESVESAINNGIKHIEIDVQLTQEGLPVVFHDNNLKVLLGIDKNMAETSYTRLSKTPLQPRKVNPIKTDYFAPLLSQIVLLIKQHKNITLYVEVKNINFQYFSYQHVYKTLIKTLKPIINQVVIIGFSYRFLRLVKKNSSTPIAYVLPSWQQYSSKMLKNLQPEIIFTDITIIPTNETFHTKKEKWVAYEVSSIKKAKQLITQGIFGLESFTPALLANKPL